MRRGAMFTLLTAAIFGAALLTFAWTPTTTPATSVSLAQLMPHGAVLYLEARDFSGMLRDWSTSQTKKDWLASTNFEAFSNSRLFLRLSQAQHEFATAAGIPPDANFLREAAGSQSAIALYDIGNLEFLYIARIQSAEAMQSALWQSRAKFEPRNAGGTNFYVRKDPSSGRVVAFALVDDYLLLATREDLLAGALQSMSGSKDPKLADDKWFSSAVTAAGDPGDLRMVLNFGALAKSPHFRSYWIERNASELRGYSSAISDVYRERGSFREERVLLRDADSDEHAPNHAFTTEGERDAAELMAAAPKEVGTYRVVANPSSISVAAAISQKLFHISAAEDRAATVAPEVALTDGNSGNASDMETRIDQPVTVMVHSSHPASAMESAMEAASVNAMMEVQSTELDAATNFVRIHSALVLSAAKDWDAAALQQAFQDEANEFSTLRLGIQWTRTAGSADDVLFLDGQFPLAVAVRGKYLLISDSPAILKKIPSPGRSVAESAPTTFAASANYRRERSTFAVLSRAIDGANFESAATAADTADFADESSSRHRTGFLSGNVRSFTQTLRALSSETVVRRESGNKVFETVIYGFER
jgi:hypothetical protein